MIDKISLSTTYMYGSVAFGLRGTTLITKNLYALNCFTNLAAYSSARIDGYELFTAIMTENGVGDMFFWRKEILQKKLL